MCWEYIDIIASNISQIKITAVSQWTATFNIQRKPDKCWCLLRNLSFGLFDHKEIPGPFQDFSRISAKFQDFPGLVGTMNGYQITEVIKPPLLRRANKIFWTIWSKLPQKSGRPLGKTFRFGTMGRFFSWLSLALLCTWHKTLLRYFHWLVGSLIQFFLQQQWGHWWQHTF